MLYPRAMNGESRSRFARTSHDDVERSRLVIGCIHRSQVLVVAREIVNDVYGRLLLPSDTESAVRRRTRKQVAIVSDVAPVAASKVVCHCENEWRPVACQRTCRTARNIISYCDLPGQALPGQDRQTTHRTVCDFYRQAVPPQRAAIQGERTRALKLLFLTRAPTHIQASPFAQRLPQSRTWPGTRKAMDAGPATSRPGRNHGAIERARYGTHGFVRCRAQPAEITVRCGGRRRVRSGFDCSRVQTGFVCA